MNFTIDNKIDTAGSFKVGYIRASYVQLVALFGEPGFDASKCHDTFQIDGKTSSEWIFRSDSGHVLTIYDYKATLLCSSRLPSIPKFRAQPSYDWHVGAESRQDAFEFIAWVNDKLEELKGAAAAPTEPAPPPSERHGVIVIDVNRLAIALDALRAHRDLLRQAIERDVGPNADVVGPVIGGIERILDGWRPG